MTQHPTDPALDSALDDAVEALVAFGQALGPRAPWDEWRAVRGLPILGAEPKDVAQWLGAVAGRLEPQEIDEVLDAVAATHLAAGLPDPTQGGRLGGSR